MSGRRGSGAVGLTLRSRRRSGLAGETTSILTPSSTTYAQRSLRISAIVKRPLFSRSETNSRGRHQTQGGLDASYREPFFRLPAAALRLWTVFERLTALRLDPSFDSVARLNELEKEKVFREVFLTADGLARQAGGTEHG